MSKDRPDREKIRKDVEKVFADVAGLEPEQHKNVLGDKWKFINAVVEYVALFPDKAPEGLLEATIQVKCEEAKREERERIIEWSKEDCPHMERTSASKSHCYKCWQALKGDKQMKLKCKKCNWIGFQEECPIVTEPSPLLEEDAEPYPVCPDCKGTILVPLGNEIQLDT